MRWSWLLPFLLALPGITSTSAAREEDDLTISSAVPLVQPGSVVLMVVASREPPGRVVASAFGKEVVFYPDPDARTWRGLVGVDVESPPGEYVLIVRAIREGRPELVVTQKLRVAPKRFPTRRLNVATRYANPPESAFERIRQESERLGAMFRSVTPHHHWRGPFLLPVGDDPTSNFGARSIFNGQSRNPHAGIDFKSREGTPVRAPNAGLIVLAENLFFTGNTIVVDHGLGLYSLLAHLSRIDVARGEAVESGAALGLVGATGRVTGPHLHWAVRLNEARVDPISLVAAFETPAAAGPAK